MNLKIKHIFSVALSIVLLIAMMPLNNVYAEDDEIQVKKISISVNEVKSEIQVIQYKNDTYFSAKDYGWITKYEYLEGEYDNVGYRLGEKFLTVNKYTGSLQIFCLNYTGSIGETIEYENEYYFSASELLPWLNVGCYEEDGVFFVIWDAISIWEVLKDFTYQDYMFNLYETYGDSTSSIVGLTAMMAFDTLINTRFDRLISADGIFGAFNGKSLYDYKCYVSTLSEIALDDCLESPVAQEVIKKSISINKGIDKIETILGIDEKELQKDMDDFLWSMGLDTETVGVFYDLSENWLYIRDAVSSYKKVSEYLNVFEVFKAYELTVKANTEYKEFLDWLSNCDTGNNVFNYAINETITTLDDEFGVLFTFYMDLANVIFANVPDLAINAIMNNTADDALIAILSKIGIATDFIGSMGIYLSIAKVVFNTIFPVAEGFEAMSKINVSESIQYYCWDLANTLREQDFTLDNLMHIRQSYITALKASKICFNSEQATYKIFNKEDILSYKIDAIDKKIAELFCSADASVNDSVEGKQEFREHLLNLFEGINFYNLADENLNSTLTIDKIRQAFVNAGNVYSKWVLSPNVSQTDIIENADLMGRTFKAVQESFFTKKSLQAELSNYFTDDVCSDIIEKNYIENDGKLYFAVWPFGIEDTIYVKKDEFINSNGELIYKVYYTVVDLDGYAQDDVCEIKILEDDQNYIFEAYSIFFARLSGGIKELYFSEDKSLTEQKSNDTNIKTTYRDLVDSLYVDGDQHCEYLIYDMDQDGTTELIYMKGSCMADLKNYYYTYKDGKTIELGKTFAHIIYKTETGQGVYTYWSRMQGKNLSLVKKTGDEIVVDEIFDNYGDSSVEECPLPDDKYLLETFRYDDYSGIEKYAISNDKNQILPNVTIQDSVESSTCPEEKQMNNDFCFNEKDDGTIEITQYFGENSNIVIPEIINNKPVSALGYRALAGLGEINSLTIPATFKDFGKDCFDKTFIKDAVYYKGDLISWCTEIGYTWDNSQPLKDGAKLYINGEFIEHLIVPEEVTEIHGRTFFAYKHLKSIQFSSTATRIHAWAFIACDGLTELIIPDNITRIDYGAFQLCKNLKTVHIGSGLEKVEGDAFYLCSTISDVYYYGTEEEWDNISFDRLNESITNAKRHYIVHQQN